MKKTIVPHSIPCRDLLSQSLAKQLKCLCPYSNDPVGAALLTLDGQFIRMYIENISSAHTVRRTTAPLKASAAFRSFAALAVVRRR
jgi:cytidine deaminase